MKIILSKSYGETTVFDKLELEIPDGEVTCVLGASGVGKTTLLNVLAGLIDFEGETFGVPENVGYIFQEPRLLPNLSVRENLLYAGAKEEEIDRALEKVGLSAHAEKRPKQLSGGEKQRVAIVRACLSHAPLLLLDEPFSSLDTALKVRLCNVCAQLWKEEKPTVVLVTHDLEEALMLGHRIVVLQNGKVVKEVRLDKAEYPATYGQVCDERGELLKIILQGEREDVETCERESL